MSDMWEGCRQCLTCRVSEGGSVHVLTTCCRYWRRCRWRDARWSLVRPAGAPGSQNRPSIADRASWPPAPGTAGGTWAHEGAWGHSVANRAVHVPSLVYGSF